MHLNCSPDYYKIQKICDKVVDTYTSVIKFVPEYFKIEETSDKTVDICPFAFHSIPDP